MCDGESMLCVLHLCEHFGGAEASLHGVARAFQWWIPLFDPTRFRVLLCSRKGPDKAYAEMCAAGLAPLTLGYGKFDPRNLFALVRLLRREHVDLLHTHGIGVGLWGRLAGLFLRIPVVVHERCNYGKAPAIMRPVECCLGPLTRHALAVSASTRDFTIRKRHIPAGRVEVLYNGILLDRVPQADPEWIQQTRAAQGVGPDTLVIGVVGRLEAHKGLLDAFGAMKALADLPLQLWVLGDGAYEATLRDWIQREGMEQRIHLLGYQRDALRWMQAFDLQLFPSHREGTPNTLFEAIAVGNALVASTCDGQGEILEQGVTAELFSPGDIPAMAAALRKLLLDPALRRQRREASKRRSADFDGRKTVRAMEDLYERILAES